MKTLPIDAYILDTLLPDLVGHDHQPSAFLVYLYLWRQTHARGARDAEVSLTALSEGTGLSRRAVQDAVSRLATRELLVVERESITSVSRYSVMRPWVR